MAPPEPLEIHSIIESGDASALRKRIDGLLEQAFFRRPVEKLRDRLHQSSESGAVDKLREKIHKAKARVVRRRRRSKPDDVATDDRFISRQDDLSAHAAAFDRSRAVDRVVGCGADPGGRQPAGHAGGVTGDIGGSRSAVARATVRLTILAAPDRRHIRWLHSDCSEDAPVRARSTPRSSFESKTEPTLSTPRFREGPEEPAQRPDQDGL